MYDVCQEEKSDRQNLDTMYIEMRNLIAQAHEYSQNIKNTFLSKDLIRRREENMIRIVSIRYTSTI